MPVLALAGDLAADCPIASAEDQHGQPMYFRQYTFADGAQDLAMTRSSTGAADIKRVTFGGSKTPGCLYHALAIARGGDWGWHLAWANGAGLSYARMDGEAWVSSPPRRMTNQAAIAISLQAIDQQVTLTWQILAAAKHYRAISHDEGRNWEAAQEEAN